MKCNERKCDCGAVVTAWAVFLRPGGGERFVCEHCLSGPLAGDGSGLQEVTCEQCQNLFATNPDYGTFFCSLTCERTWKAAHTFDTVPF